MANDDGDRLPDGPVITREAASVVTRRIAEAVHQAAPYAEVWTDLTPDALGDSWLTEVVR